MRRRRALEILLAVLGVLVLLAWWRPAWLAGAMARRLTPRLDRASPTGSLSPHETENIVAFADVVVTGRALGPEERGYVVEHVAEQTGRAPGYLSLYRATSSLLDSLAGQRFSGLDRPLREDLVARHDLGNPDVRVRELFWPFRRGAQRVRALAVPDLIAGYHASPAGWALVGYTVFPGRPGDLVRYTRAEA